jgi:hypothetical protein
MVENDILSLRGRGVVKKNRARRIHHVGDPFFGIANHLEDVE